MRTIITASIVALAESYYVFAVRFFAGFFYHTQNLNPSGCQ